MAENPTRQGGAQVLPGMRFPMPVINPSGPEDPAALIAINQVSHRLVEVPCAQGGVGGMASGRCPALFAQFRRWQAADQLGQQAGSFVPAQTAINR